MKKILLTGASGFVGSNFLRHALEKGFDVIAITRDLRDKNFHAHLEWYEADLTTEHNWEKLFDRIDVVVHTAAEINDENVMQLVNFDAPLRLVDAAIGAGVRRWVQLSSVGTYGRIETGIVDESRDDCPESRYEKTKSDFDIALIEASKLSCMEVCIIRPSNVYGPGMRNQSMEQMLDAICKNLFTFIGPIGASANYVHVRDVVQAIDLCMNRPRAANQIYIVSAWATVETMVRALGAGAGITPSSRRVSLAAAIWLARMMQNLHFWPLTYSRVRALSSRCSYSTGKIEKELGWQLTVPVDAGMRDLSRHLNQ